MTTNDHETIPQSFCVAPWIHAHVGANGRRRLCCISNEVPHEFAKIKYDDFKNSSYLKNIRQKMMSGVLPDECHNCVNLNRASSYKDLLNEQYADKIPNIFNLTDHDGSTKVSLNYIDYRSNLCNLKCRTCNPGSSSAFQNHINKQIKEVADILYPNQFGRDEKEIIHQYTQKYSAEVFQLIKENEIDRFYFAGGEPVLEPMHLKLLDELILTGRHNCTQLIYNTNLSYSESILENWILRINQFKNVKIFVSLDGFGNVGEYIREGLNFEIFKKNLNRLILCSEVEVVLDKTLTSLNLFFLEDFVNFALNSGVSRVVSKLMVADDFGFPLLKTEAIPEEVKNMLLERWNNFYTKLPVLSREKLFNLNEIVQLFGVRTQNTSYSKDDYLNRLEMFESMYPNKSKFIDLLQEDELGKMWASILK